MNSLKSFGTWLRNFIQQTLSTIEESPLFEQLVSSYENADPRRQKQILVGSYAGGLLLVLGLFLIPLFSLWSIKGDLSSMRNLTADIKAFNVKGKVVYKPAPPPMGWQPITAGNMDEFEQSVTQFMSSMGVPADLTNVTKTGDGLEIKTTGASLRQLSALLFLFDGWQPGIKIKNLETSVNKDSREMIDFLVFVNFDADAASKVAAGRGGDPAAAINSFMKAPSGPTSSNGAPGTFEYPNSQGDNNGPPQGNFEEYSEPTEPPPDLPPPPPLEEDL